MSGLSFRSTRLDAPFKLLTKADTGTFVGNGHVSKENRRTQARFECVDCGYENNADVVGAINILERGYRLLACGEPVKSGRSVKQEPAEATTQELALV